MPAQTGYYDTLKSVAGKVFTFLSTISLTGVDGKTLTVNENLTLAGVSGKSLTVNQNSTVDQDLSTTAGPTHDHLHITSGQIYGFPYSLNDDAATSFTLPSSGVVLAVVHVALASSSTRQYGIASTYAGYNTATSVLASAAFDVTGGALAGTTGTDGKFTVSACNDGKFYLENRLGGIASISVTLLGIVP